MAQEMERRDENEATATERATAVKDRAAEQAGQVTATVKSQAAGLAEEAAQQGRVVVERAREQMLAQGRERAGEAARSLHGLTDELEALADGRPGDAPRVAGYVRSVAGRTGDVANRLETDGLDGLLTDVTRFARRRPAVFLLAAGAAGFVVGRAVRSGAMSASNGTSNGSHPSPYANGPGAAPGVSGRPEAARVAELSYDPRLSEDDPSATAPMDPLPSSAPEVR
jgi:hypothetical protein